MLRRACKAVKGCVASSGGQSNWGCRADQGWGAASLHVHHDAQGSKVAPYLTLDGLGSWGGRGWLGDYRGQGCGGDAQPRE